MLIAQTSEAAVIAPAAKAQFGQLAQSVRAQLGVAETLQRPAAARRIAGSRGGAPCARRKRQPSTAASPDAIRGEPLFIGLMSGTSLDGVDGVLVDFAAGAARARVARAGARASRLRRRRCAPSCWR